MKTAASASVVVLCLLLAACSTGIDRDPAGALGHIRETDIHREIFYLASDSLKGRDTPSPGLDSAAAFIAREFARDGLRPVNGSYYQPVLLHVVGLGEANILRVTNGAEDRLFEIKTDYVPFEMTANREVHGQLVFAGYGITAPELRYDDYASIDVKGKIVVVLRHEPGEEDSASIFSGKKLTDYSSVATKVRIAMEHGAVGVMVATDPLNHRLLMPQGFPWPSLSRIIPKDALPLTLGVGDDQKIPVVHIGESVVEMLFGSVDSLKSLQRSIDQSVSPRSFPLQGFEGTIRTTTDIRVLHASNVVGVLPGADPKFGGEVVLVGAHYDHVGQKKEHAEGERYIYNGADDNASGATALLGVAAGLGALQSPPRRTVVCIAFAGEEKGLLGSEYYARHPLFSLSVTVAMLNMDMVGRNAPDSLQLIGSDGSPDLARIAREEDGRIGFVLTDEEIRGGGSDHMTFMKRNIPNLFFHSGLEGEYHTVNDRPELINTGKLTRVAGLAFLTAYHIAMDTVRYHYNQKPVTLF